LKTKFFGTRLDNRDAFTIGSRALWELHNAAADDDDGDEELFDVNSFKKKKNTPPLSVKKTF
jgi:hypothetical protein